MKSWLTAVNIWLKNKVFDWLDIESDLSELRREMEDEIQEQMSGLVYRDDLDSEINNLRTDLEDQIADVQNEGEL